MKNLVFFEVCGFISLSGCGRKEESEQIKTVAKPEIASVDCKSPVAHIKIPFIEKQVIGSKGGKLQYESGAEIIFPPNAFVAADGKKISGKVTVLFREYRDPVDIYISGIPMIYNGGTFESKGMCDIRAMVDGKPVFVNPDAKPRVSLSKGVVPKDFGVYYFDTVSNAWQKKAETLLTKQIDSVSEDTFEFTTDEDNLGVYSPLWYTKPRKPSGRQHIFSVDIPFADMVPELQIFKNTRFEVVAGETHYDPEEADREWDAVKIHRSAAVGTYNISFFSKEKAVTYRVRPVFEGKDYAEALKAFEAESAKYEQQRRESAKQRAAEEQLRLRNSSKTVRVKAAVRGYFEIDNFGIWNVDCLLGWNAETIFAQYINEKSDTIDVSEAFMMRKGVNALVRLNDGKVMVSKNAVIAIWTIHEGKFLYFPFYDFEKIKTFEPGKSHVFQMRTCKDSITGIDHLKKLIEL